MLEVYLLEVGTVLRLDRDAWSMVKRLRQATISTPPPLARNRTLVPPTPCTPLRRPTNKLPTPLGPSTVTPTMSKLPTPLGDRLSLHLFDAHVRPIRFL